MGFHAELNGLDLHSPSRETVVGGISGVVGDIPALKCVKVVGMGDFFPKVERANGETDKIAGVVVTAITHNATGSMWTVGKLTNINTSQWLAGTLLYANDSGDLVSAPTTTILKAVCLEQHSASGALYVYNTIAVGQTDLSGLTDVGALTASANDVLVWDGTSWSATALSGVGAHINLSSLANVGGLTPSAGDILIYDGVNWSATAACGIASYFNLSSVADVNMSACLSTNDILVYDTAASVWSATALSSVAMHFGLSSVSDVVGGASANDALVWYVSSSQWKPGAAGGGGGSVIFWNDTCGNAPFEEYINGMRTRKFIENGSQTLYGHVVVPSSHQAGKQINLITSIYTTATGQVRLGAEVDLIRMGTDSMSSTANHYSSTNTLMSITGANIPYKLTIPLTNAVGAINAIAISGSDGAILTIGIKSLTDSASAGIYMLTDIMEVEI